MTIRHALTAVSGAAALLTGLARAHSAAGVVTRNASTSGAEARLGALLDVAICSQKSPDTDTDTDTDMDTGD